MNRTVVYLIILIAAVAAVVYFFVLKEDPVTEGAGAGAGATSGATAEVTEATQAAIDFCTEKGGTVETVTAAEGVTHLCVHGEDKVEVSKYMADNKTE